MSCDRPASDPVTLTLVVVPGFPLHSLALSVDCLRVANREALATLFDWRIASEYGHAVLSSAGIEMPVDVGIAALAFSPVTLVFAGYEPEQATGVRLTRWLRQQERKGGAVGCVDTGALVLARAGLSPALWRISSRALRAPSAVAMKRTPRVQLAPGAT